MNKTELHEAIRKQRVEYHRVIKVLGETSRDEVVIRAALRKRLVREYNRLKELEKQLHG